MLEAGDELTESSVNPHDILKIKDFGATQDYMLRKYSVYTVSGVEINIKHIEVIVRQMLKKIRIEEKGDTEFLPGTMVDVLDFESKRAACCRRKRARLQARSYLKYHKGFSGSSPSCQPPSRRQQRFIQKQLSRVKLTIVGLKENVIIGKHIPAGTGMKKYRDVKLNTDIKMER